MITCVIPMAGAGSRFTRAGHVLPKYAIPARGRPMLAWALDSLPLPLFDRLVLVAQRSAVAVADPLALLPLAQARRVTDLVLLDGPTGGQADSVLAARHHIDERGLLVYNCDTHFHSPTLAGRLADPAQRADGVLGAFAGSGTHWSFARLGPDGAVLETAEKRRISDHCLTGLYHFSRGTDFLAAAGEGIRALDEHYVAPLYNALIRQGRRFVLDTAERFEPIGTPAELAVFEGDAACAA